jgi:indoleacetamide hydrolase
LSYHEKITSIARYMNNSSLTPQIQLLLELAGKSKSLGAYTHIASAAEVIFAKSANPVKDNSLLLANLPLIVKDNIDVAGMPTTAGSKALGAHVPTANAPAIARLVEAGASILGKANLHEFSLGITTNNSAFGPARNPYSHEHIPGGSSGGTASAVSAGLVPAGIGSDTGGSLRIPAALCGIVGFRPSTGRWPSQGVVTISNTRDTVGPIAKTVANCALLDAVVCKADINLSKIAPSAIRLGIPRAGFWENLEPSVAAHSEQFLNTLRASGVQLVDVTLPINLDDCTQAGMVIALYELWPNLQAYLKQHNKPCDAHAIANAVSSPDVRGLMQMLLGPEAPPQSAYEEALNTARPAFQKAYAECFAEHRLDALIFPTTPLPAARIGEDETVQLNGQTVPTFLTFTRNVGPGSLVGLPGICLPIGVNENGLPLSIALDGPSMSDRALLAVATTIETLLPAMPKPKSL